MEAEYAVPTVSYIEIEALLFQMAEQNRHGTGMHWGLTGVVKSRTHTRPEHLRKRQDGPGTQFNLATLSYRSVPFTRPASARRLNS